MWPRCACPPNSDRTSSSNANAPMARKVTTKPVMSGASDARAGGEDADRPGIYGRTPAQWALSPSELAERGGENGGGAGDDGVVRGTGRVGAVGVDRQDDRPGVGRPDHGDVVGGAVGESRAGLVADGPGGRQPGPD